MDEQNSSKEKYLQDIQLIKDVLVKQGKRPIIEFWVFYSWSALIIIASLIQFFITKYSVDIPNQLVLKIWIPTTFIGGIFETLGWYRNSEKEKLLIKSKTNLSILHLMIIMCSGIMLIYAVIIKLNGQQYLPVIVLVISGIFFAIFVSYMATNMHFICEILILAGLIFFLFNFHGPVADIVVGLIMAIMFTGAGLLYRKTIKAGKK